MISDTRIDEQIHAEEIAAYRIQIMRLKQLVRDMMRCTDCSHGCHGCTINGSGCGAGALHGRMRELGIEVG